MIPLRQEWPEALAAKYFANEDPIGKRMTIGYNRTGPREIVGIVRNVKRGSLADAAEPQMYTTFEQTPWPFLAAVVRTTATSESAAIPGRVNCRPPARTMPKTTAPRTRRSVARWRLR